MALDVFAGNGKAIHLAFGLNVGSVSAALWGVGGKAAGTQNMREGFRVAVYYVDVLRVGMSDK
jgi:hypothetical protein